MFSLAERHNLNFHLKRFTIFGGKAAEIMANLYIPQGTHKEAGSIPENIDVQQGPPRTITKRERGREREKRKSI